MSEFTFLTEEQVYGDNQLDVLKIYGRKCGITDFSILLGGYVSEQYFCSYFNSEGNFRNECAGWWWTKTPYKDDDITVCSIGDVGNQGWCFFCKRYCGARPVLPYASISSISSNGVRGRSGILEVEYGEYPQTVVSEKCAKILEKAYLHNTVNRTGKVYTTDSVSLYYDADIPFQARKHPEYENNGRKYIRILGDESSKGKVLSDGRMVQVGETYWVEVEPIRWLVDEKTDLAISKKIIFSGVYFDTRKKYRGDFENTFIKLFMDTYFSKDIVPSFTKNIFLEEKDNMMSSLNTNILVKKRNPYGFNFGEVSEEDIIRGAIESGVAVFLHGPSSEGKSSRVKQIDPNCVIIYLRNATPESLNGKSVYNSETGEMMDIKPTWLKKLEDRCASEPDKYHIVFFDEITNALPSIQGIAFNIVLDREVNGIWQLPDNARIVAAGNDMKDSLAANQLAEPLFNRFAHVYIQTTVESWLKWASENNIHPAIYAYIAYKKDEVLRSKYDGEKPNADPRKWEMASRMLYATGQPEMLRALVGEDITKEFCEFCNQRVIVLEDVLKGNYTERDLQMDTSEKYATVLGLTQVGEDNFEIVREFCLKLGGEFCALFDSLWTRDNESRMEMIAEARLVKEKGRGR